MAQQTRIKLIVSVVVAIVLFAAGILTGHFAIEKSDNAIDDKTSGEKESLSVSCDVDQYTTDGEAYKNRYVKNCVQNSCYPQGSCNTFGLPRTYLAYHLNGKTINMDGQLDDEAWGEVPWAEISFDMRGPDSPKPYLNTKVKVRWDDERLYIGAHVEETDFWGTITDDESEVWRENSFDVFVMADNSMHNYKEMEINVLNTTWDLRLKKAYVDTDGQCPAENVVDSDWSSQQEKNVYTDGVINDPSASQKGTFWSVEWSFTFDALSEYTNRSQTKPDVNESWFMNFFRTEYKVKVENGAYVKDTDAHFDAWAWQPTHDDDPHFPSRFGLVQFKKDRQDDNFTFDRWHLYKALFEVFEAQKKNRVLKREYSPDLAKIEIPPFVMSTMCADVNIVSASSDDFEATAKSRMDTSLPTAHIRADRYVWFTDN